MYIKTIALSTVAGTALIATGAMADVSATAAADLNIRTGPGPQYQIVGVIPASGSAEVMGCVASSKWCEVTYDGTSGWSYAPYLTIDEGETALSQAAQAQHVTVVEFDDTDAENATLVGTGVGAAVGALVAGPIGAMVGGFVTGTAAGMAADSDVVVYATENPVSPVILEGEVVAGAVVPPEVTVYDVPDNTQYAYLNVNGNTVIIDADTREIVQIVR